MVRNITLSVEESLINQARLKAEQERTSLNKLFRDWVSRYVNRESIAENFDTIMESLSTIDSGGSFTRDEMNER